MGSQGSLPAWGRGCSGRDGFWAAGSEVSTALCFGGCGEGKAQGQSRGVPGSGAAAPRAPGLRDALPALRALRRRRRRPQRVKGSGAGGGRGLPGAPGDWCEVWSGAAPHRPPRRLGPHRHKALQGKLLYRRFLSPRLSPPLPSPSPAPFPSSPRSLNGIPAGRAAGRHHRASRGAEPLAGPRCPSPHTHAQPGPESRKKN